MIYLLLTALVCEAGFPGPESRADYRMEARLVPDSQMVICTSTILFTSGVDYPVDTLWLHLYPNAYRDPSTPFGRDMEAAGSYGFRASGAEERGWLDLFEWELDGDPVTVEVDDCLGYIALRRPLPPGGTLTLSGGFALKVPFFWSRLGHSGDTYQITQWYPKMCVLDPRGWHSGRYRRRGEFYSDFGDYRVEITVPREFITAATGRVAGTVFSEDSTLRTDTWLARDVHDFVWSASPDYHVREHTFHYPEDLGGDGISVHLVLLDDDPGHWEDVPAVIDSTLLYYGQWYCPYPYPDLWVVEPAQLTAGGMEYPQFVFSAAEIPLTRALEMVTAHEIGHQWFYGILANDEVNEAWLDEGMNTFSELRYMERRHGFHGNMTTTPDWLLSVSDRELTLTGYVSGTAGFEKMPVLSDATSAGDGSHPTGFTYYSKPALFVSMLRDQAGEDEFDHAMDLYFRRFMFHHPHTDDFMEVLEQVTGESWDREFDYWLRGTGNADLVLADLRCSEESTTVVLSGDLPHSLDPELLLVDGEDSLLSRVHMEPGETVSLTVPGTWSRAVADPFSEFPDRAPWNNSLPPLSQVRPLLLPVPRPTHYGLWLLPFPSYGAGSWRGELLLMSTPLPSYMGGPYTFTGSVSLPFSTGSWSSWGSYVHFPLFRGRHRELFGSVGLERGYGIGKAFIGAEYRSSGRVPSDPSVEIGLGIRLFSVEDTTVYGGRNLEEGRGVEAAAGLQVSDEGYRFSWKGDLEFLGSPGWEEGPYGTAEVTFDLRTRLSGGWFTRSRLYAGRVAGDAPRHVLLRPGGGLFADGIVGAFLPPDGTLSPQEHYYVRSGPALPGYRESHVRGRAALTAEQRLDLPAVPLEVYWAGGWLADGFEGFSGDSFMSELGVALRLAMMEVLFPLWVSDPGEGEEDWNFRWRIGLHPSGFPDLY
ncbi:MAG: hypothetical protein AVO35_09520 [Candidatus Aegiribacteria sp. MLS_C]|nr:MAG: hypothetical protein AVO35_09520 [Candidatus Aegiribacteria sp. MLS_C]